MEKNKNIKEVNIKIEGTEWAKAMDEAFEKANKKVKIDGFRPGKAPKDVFLKKYGKESLYMDASEICLEKAYRKLFEENENLEIVAQPEVSIKNIDENGVEFIFTLTLRPEVKLGKYKGLDVKKKEIIVTDEEVEEAVEQMRGRYSEYVIKEDEIVEENDIAVIDFEGFLDGVAFEGGKGENYSLKIGSHTFIEGFEEQLIGMKKGEEKEINVTFPEDYHSENLKGKPVTFKVKVNEIKKIVIPELDKEFFEDLGMEGINTKEELYTQIKENIVARKQMEAENQYIDELLEKASSNMEVDIPDVMIDDEVHRMIHQYEDNLRMQGLTLEQFYKFTNSTEKDLKERMKEEATRRVRYRLLLEEIIKKEKIEVTDEDANKEAQSLADKYQMEKEDFIKEIGGLEMIKYDLQMRKAIDVLKG